jgi:hypothetical protein
MERLRLVDRNFGTAAYFNGSGRFVYHEQVMGYQPIPASAQGAPRAGTTVFLATLRKPAAGCLDAIVNRIVYSGRSAGQPSSTPKSGKTTPTVGEGIRAIEAIAKR